MDKFTQACLKECAIIFCSAALLCAGVGFISFGFLLLFKVITL